MDYTKIPEKHHDKYDFVISASMINNDGFDSRVFKDLLKCLKLGGFVIFATKLNFAQENQYESGCGIMVSLLVTTQHHEVAVTRCLGESFPTRPPDMFKPTRSLKSVVTP